MSLDQNKVRIIGGKWRGRMITFPKNIFLRPTPNRVRETVFNWLGQDMDGKVCLDLFAGSGAMGIEAASRGSKQVVMVESNYKIYSALQKNLKKLRTDKIKLFLMDAQKFMIENQQLFDLIILDPPYQSGLLPGVLNILPSHLTKNGLIYLESGDLPCFTEIGKNWSVWRDGKAGRVQYQLLRYEKD